MCPGEHGARLECILNAIRRRVALSGEVMMKALTAALASALFALALYAAADVSGTWEIEATFDDVGDGAGGFDCVVKQTAEKLTGDCSGGSAPLSGEVDGQKVVWRVGHFDNSFGVTTFSGTVDESGRVIEGRFTAGNKGGSFRAGKQVNEHGDDGGCDAGGQQALRIPLQVHVDTPLSP
jgi:hypothetical protein